MNITEFVEWENRFIASTHRIPPGRDIPAVLEAGDVQATRLELWRWIAEQLHAVVDKLPKNAENAPVVPKIEDVWHPAEPRPGILQDDREVEFDRTGDGDWHYHPIGECYGTRQAADAAGGE